MHSRNERHLLTYLSTQSARASNFAILQCPHRLYCSKKDSENCLRRLSEEERREAIAFYE